MGVFWGIVAVFAYVVSSFAHGSAPPGVLDNFLRVGRSYQRTQDFPPLDSLNGSYVSCTLWQFREPLPVEPILLPSLETKLYGNYLKQLGSGLARLRNSPAYASYGRTPAEPHCSTY